MNIADTSIPEYSADDFYNSTSPYEFLYTYKDNALLSAQMCEKMKAQAQKLGVRSFIKLWNSYCKGENSKKGIKPTNVTEFEGQPIELISGNYICDENGVSLFDRAGYEIQICKHPIMPTQRLVNIDTGEERLKIAFKKGFQWREIIVEKTIIASSNGIISLSANGVLVNSENAKQLSTFLLELEQMNYEDIPEQKSVGRLGWIGTKFSPYVDDVVFDGELSFKHNFNSVKLQGEFEAWRDIMLKVRRSGIAGRLFLASSFSSVILELCGLLPFVVHVWGGTEVGKSVGLMIAASVWANPKMGDYITTFNSTGVAQELYAGFLNSLPMCIDELQIQSSSGIKDFDRMIYQLTEGIGRGRGAKTGGLQKPKTWRNCIITNGEHPISNGNSGGGAVNRVIEYECSEKVFRDLPLVCSVITQNYGHAGKMFVELLRKDGVIDEVKNMQKLFYKKLTEGESTDKQAASASAILVADAIVTKMIFKDDNALTVEDISKIMVSKQDVDAGARALDYIRETIAKNPNKFKPNEFGDYQGEVWGTVGLNCVYIIKSVFDKEMSNGGFNSTAFLSWAKRRGLLEFDIGTRTKKFRVCGSPVNCVCLINSKVD